MMYLPFMHMHTCKQSHGARYRHTRLTRETRHKRTIAVVRAVVKNEVGYQEKLKQDAADIEAKEAAAAKTGEGSSVAAWVQLLGETSSKWRDMYVFLSIDRGVVSLWFDAC